jgi:hypothetical protein
MQHAMSALRQQQISIADFCQAWRAQRSLLSGLPSRYEQVMEDLLGRLEAGSLFTEESCSFSQADLQSSLEVWLEKARQQVQAK